MEEILVNLHMHTVYSDGSGTHADIGRAALKAGIDAAIVTDHNTLVREAEGYFIENEQRALVLVGEEIHDRTRQPQRSHLLVLGAGREMAPYGSELQFLLNQVNLAMDFYPLEEIPWEDWQVQGYTGMEIWNGMSEFKGLAHSKLFALLYGFFPSWIARGANPQVLKKWDELTAAGKRVVAVGSSDAHAFRIPLGPFIKTAFPYAYHFRQVNNHLLVEEKLNGDLSHDRQLILGALHQGHSFVAYDLPEPARGFSYTAAGKNQNAIMGDSLRLSTGVTFQIHLPFRGPHCTLLRNGQPVKTWRNSEFCTHITNQPGAYRVEVRLPFRLRERGWIYSNPIYISTNDQGIDEQQQRYPAVGLPQDHLPGL
jgi:hypothetical protein